MKTGLRRLAIAFSAMLALSGITLRADTINFSEIALPNFTDLTTEYSALNVTFQDTFYVFDARFSENGVGITTTANPATINFIVPVTGLSISWLSLDTDFYADAYDSANNLLSSFHAGPCGNPCTGTAGLGGSAISRLVWHDNLRGVGIDSVSFRQQAVPEPSALILLAGALGAIGWRARKAR